MRWPLLVTCLVTAVLLASVFGGLAVHPGSVVGATPQSGVRPFATDTIVPTDAQGFTQFEFSPGLGSGNVYFTATDPLDTTAVVQVNDQNATRDGLHNPVASWTVNLTGGANQSWLYNTYYQIPLALKLGGQWNITISGTAGGFASTNFEVFTYVVRAASSVSVALPGQPGSLYYNLVWTVNDAADNQVSTLTILGTYYDATAAAEENLSGFPMTLTNPTALSSVPFTTPATASTGVLGGLLFQLYANSTGGSYPNSEATAVEVGVGTLDITALTLAPCPGCGNPGFYPAGSAAYLSITGEVEGQAGSAPASGAQANLVFSANGKPIATTQVPGAPPAALTLNTAGQGTAFFWVDIPPFSVVGENGINVSLTDPWSATANKSSEVVNFTTARESSFPGFSVAFQYTHYYSGEQVTAEWQLGNYGNGSSAGWTVGQWIAGDANSDEVFATGDVNSTAASGTIPLLIPRSFTGTLLLDVVANNATSGIAAEGEANVTAVVLLLSPSEYTYSPGDLVSVGVNVNGVAGPGLTLTETATDLGGNYLSSGSVAVNGSFSVQVPTVDTPTEIELIVTAQNASAGILASQTLVLEEVGLFSWSTWVSTASSYSDNSYQPGQTVQISYSLTALGTAQLPTQFEILVGGVGSTSIPAHAVLIQTSSATGQIAVTIPNNAPNGVQLLEVEAVTGPGTLSFYDSIVALNIEKNPSALNYELGSGTGLTVGWLILLVLIVVVAVLMVLLLARRGRRGDTPKPPVQPYNPPSGPAPTEPGGGVWNEQGPTGPVGPTPPDQPPLPPPST